MNSGGLEGSKARRHEGTQAGKESDEATKMAEQKPRAG